MLGVSAMVITAFSVWFVTRRLMQPIVELRHTIESEKMRRTLKFMDIPTEIDEINLLQRAFANMAVHIKETTELIAAMRENELKLKVAVLQAQINPHFLYNFIAVIGAAGMEDGSFRTQMMCVQLSELLRYSGSDMQQPVTVRDEISNLSTYLSCMKYRHEDNFVYEVLTEGDLEKDYIPKLTFQPLAENAFVHGFSKVLPPYEMQVRCTVSDAGWELEITDNGYGIAEEKIREICDAMGQIDHVFMVSREYMKLKTENMAILSIYIRLKKLYEENVKFLISNRKNARGTVVKIQVKRGMAEDGQSSDSR